MPIGDARFHFLYATFAPPFGFLISPG